MIRNLKALGLAVMAMFAMGAVAASSASADFVSGSHETILAAESTKGGQTFTTPGGLFVTCENVGVEHTTIGTTEESITAVPVYGTCLLGAEGVEAPAHVSMNGCAYEFTTDTEVHIECPEGKQIEVKGEFVPPFKSKCLDIPEQTPTDPTVHYENQGSGDTMHVEIESTVDGITYETTGICGEGLHHDAAYHGDVTVTGENPAGEHVAVTVAH
jgi:hypothetical protein